MQCLTKVTDSSYTHFHATDNTKYKLSSTNSFTFWLKYLGEINEAISNFQFPIAQTSKLCEKTKDNIPITLLMCLEFSHYPNIYKDFYRTIVKELHKTLEIYTHVNIDEDYIFKTIALKMIFEKQSKYRLVVRIQLPYFVVESQFQKDYLLDELCERLQRKNILKYLSSAPSNSISDWFSKKVYNKGVPIFGNEVYYFELSSWNPKEYHYEISSSAIETEEYNYEDVNPEDVNPDDLDPEDLNPEESGYTSGDGYEQEIASSPDDDDAYDTTSGDIDDSLSLIQCFNPSNHSDISKSSGSGFIISNQSEEYFLPVILSIYYHDRFIRVNTGQSHLSGRVDDHFDPFEEPEVACKFFLSNIPDNILNDPIEGVEVGIALYRTIGDRGIELWKSRRQFHDSISREVDQIKGTSYPITIKTLAWYAREYSPQSYYEWFNNWLYKIYNELIDSAKLLDYTLARYFYRYYWLEYVYMPGDKSSGQWYVFSYQNRRWICEGSNEKILDSCFRLSSHFMGYNKIETQRAQLSDNNNERQNHTNNCKKIAEIANRFGDITPCKKIIESSKPLFAIDNFESLLDTRIYTTAFKNGVVKIRGDKINFYPGKPEDYVKCFSPIEYNPSIDENCYPMWKFADLMRKYFPENKENHFMYKFLSSLLVGQNFEKYMYVFTGEGNNGKTTFNSIIKTAFGSYVVDSNPEILKNNNDSGRPSPEYARLKGTRLNIIPEPDRNQQFSLGAVKKLTGQDKFFARFLNMNGFEIEATFKTQITSNDIPKFGLDDATIQRLLEIVFESTFDHEAPSDSNEQFRLKHFPIDEEVVKYQHEIAKGLIHYAILYWPYYHNEGLKGNQVPDKFKDATKRYWMENNLYFQFAIQNIRVCMLSGDELNFDYYIQNIGNLIRQGYERDKSVSMNCETIYRQCFVPWYNNNFSTRYTPNLNEFRDNMSTKSLLGKAVNGEYWLGFRYVTDEENNLEDDNMGIFG